MSTSAPSERRYSLRITIAMLVVGLLVLTVAGVLTIALLIRRQTVSETARALQTESSARITEKLTERFSPLRGTLRECVSSTVDGLLSVDDVEKVAAHFAQRLRYDRRVEWLGFLGEDGRLAAALHDPESGIRVLSRAGGPEAPLSAERWHEDGRREPLEGMEQALSGVRKAAWYELGAASVEPAWTAPYVRPYDGTIGRACALALRNGDDLVGVFGLGFGVAFLQTYVQSIRVGETGRVFFVRPDTGAIVTAPSPEDLERLGPAVEAAVARLPGGAGGLDPGRLASLAVDHGGAAYRVGIELQHPPGFPAWIHAIVIPEDDLVGYLGKYLLLGLGGVVALLLASIALAHILSRRVSRPLRVIAQDLERVGDFDLSDADTPPSLIEEIVVVGDSVERMKASLRSFGRYVPTDLVRDLLKQGQEARLGGGVRDLTLFFSDVEGFTTLSEGMEPQALVDALGDYLDVVTRIAQEHAGTVDKFMGDGVLAFFNAPRRDPAHPLNAARAALEVQAVLADEIPKWEEAGRPAFKTRIGLHTDRVLVGNIGTHERFSYTVIGDGVNFASRLEGINKVYGTWILASEEMRAATGDAFVWRCLDRTAVAGRAEGGRIYELLGERDHVPTSILDARNEYETALEAYFERRFGDATKGFAEAERIRPYDRAAVVLRERSERYAAEPPPPDWNGVFVQTAK